MSQSPSTHLCSCCALSWVLWQLRTMSWSQYTCGSRIRLSQKANPFKREMHLARFQGKNTGSVFFPTGYITQPVMTSVFKVESVSCSSMLRIIIVLRLPELSATLYFRFEVNSDYLRLNILFSDLSFLW